MIKPDRRAASKYLADIVHRQPHEEDALDLNGGILEARTDRESIDHSGLRVVRVLDAQTTGYRARAGGGRLNEEPPACPDGAFDHVGVNRHPTRPFEHDAPVRLRAHGAHRLLRSAILEFADIPDERVHNPTAEVECISAHDARGDDDRGDWIGLTARR